MRQRHARRLEPGVGLVEILVATAVFAVVITAALVQYRATRRAHAVGDALVELQQSVRVGFDRITADLAVAGLAVHPDEQRPRPDEGIEAAYAAAIVIRGDFDGHGSGATDPEHALAGTGPFRTVTTGNDEIVGYVLSRSDGSSGGAIRFDADVLGVPRDGRVETTTIDDIARAHDAPPYTLYRVSVQADSTRVARSPVADNIRSLRFAFFDEAGNPIDPPGGAEDDASRQARASIRRIRVELEGVVRDPDPRWRDPGDDDPATRRYRKFKLTGVVSPRNLGLAGWADRGPHE
jgi:hypothetical protein